VAGLAQGRKEGRRQRARRRRGLRAMPDWGGRAEALDWGAGGHWRIRSDGTGFGGVKRRDADWERVWLPWDSEGAAVVLRGSGGGRAVEREANTGLGFGWGAWRKERERATGAHKQVVCRRYGRK
jgi:hypothetical protein